MLLVFIVALLNLCLGYALAVYLAPRLGFALLAPATSTKSSQPSRSAGLAPKVRPEADVPATQPSLPSAVETTPDIPQEWLVLLDETEVGHSFIEASMQVLELEVGRYRDELIRIDTRVRQCLVTPDGVAIDECLDDLKHGNANWLARQEEVACHLRARKDNLGEFSSMGESLEETLQEQAAQIETTCGNIEHLNFAGDPTAGCQWLIGEIGNLLDMAHNLRDRMHDSLLAIVLQEQRLETLDKRLQTDDLTGVYNRSGMERVLYEWWRDDPSRIRQASVAMLDLDRFGRLNEQHGVTVGDRVLQGFAELLQELIGKDREFDLLCRFSGQRFVVFFGDTGPRAATNTIERIRQTIEVASFEYDGAEIQVTVSCGVTEVTVGDSTTTLFERLRKTMREAKKAGCNGTCLDDGVGPGPVEPPTFEVKDRIVRLRK